MELFTVMRRMPYDSCGVSTTKTTLNNEKSAIGIIILVSSYAMMEEGHWLINKETSWPDRLEHRWEE